MLWTQARKNYNHHGDFSKDSPEARQTSQRYEMEWFEGGSLIGPTLCQEVPASRTAKVSFSSLGVP